jgi:hypothetical protein
MLRRYSSSSMSSRLRLADPPRPGSELRAPSARRSCCWPAVRLAEPRSAALPGPPVLAARRAALPGHLARVHFPVAAVDCSLVGRALVVAVRLRPSPAVSLVARVSADHCSYRALPASRRWRSAASCAARAAALTAAVWSCWVWASAACRWASASACAVSRSWLLTSGGAAARARSSWRTRASSSPRSRSRIMSASSRISSALNLERIKYCHTHVLELGVAGARHERDGLVGAVIPAAFR